MSSKQTDRMGFTNKQKKLLEERRCFKCEKKMSIIDKIPMFGGYVDSWGCTHCKTKNSELK